MVDCYSSDTGWYWVAVPRLKSLPPKAEMKSLPPKAEIVRPKSAASTVRTTGRSTR